MIRSFYRDRIAMKCFDCDEEVGVRYWTFSAEERQFTMGLPVQALLCYSCWRKRDNYEPPEPDGEAFRGGEAAAFEAETQARIQRELK